MQPHEVPQPTSRGAEELPGQAPSPTESWEIVSYCSKPLSLGIVYYSAIDNRNEQYGQVLNLYYFKAPKIQPIFTDPPSLCSPLLKTGGSNIWADVVYLVVGETQSSPNIYQEQCHVQMSPFITLMNQTQLASFFNLY